MKLIITALSILLASNLNAEIGYQYVVPDSDFGRLCVNQCKQLEQLKKEN
ncbi:hypothetical protein [Abyssogena phaseoliformis symbiont]|nr:hypothetical protein [Abyssogena phaseoliformis symbiont]MBW5289364.1 hypothetical protein [Candidatus Ruthia sp. Apha_13_S6]